MIQFWVLSLLWNIHSNDQYIYICTHITIYIIYIYISTSSPKFESSLGSLRQSPGLSCAYNTWRLQLAASGRRMLESRSKKWCLLVELKMLNPINHTPSNHIVYINIVYISIYIYLSWFESTQKPDQSKIKTDLAKDCGHHLVGSFKTRPGILVIHHSNWG